MITFHALHGKTNHCSITALPLPYLDVLLECFYAQWHVAAYPVHLQSSMMFLDLGLLVVLPHCSGWVPSSMTTGLSFPSLAFPGDPRVLCVSAYVNMPGVCSTEADELAAADICIGLKEGRIDILLSEFSLVTGGLSGGFPEFCCKTKFVFCFHF